MVTMENKVSIWFGNFETEDKFFDFIKKDYDEDGNSIPSSFMRVFEIGFFDEDFQEAFYENPMDESSFEDVSYYEMFSDKVKVDFSKYNCAILLYKFNYTGLTKKANNMEFYSVLDYA